MRSPLRENALCSLIAAACCLAMAWLGLYGFAWSDYEVEAMPAFEALVHGHVSTFLALAPAYGGSLVERAPFAMLANIWGGGSLAVYRLVALPCLLASAVLAVWLVAQMRSRGSSTLARAVVLGLCVANPITLKALEIGHPEELLGACLCVAAVLLASSRSHRSGAGAVGAGVLLGLAIANKEWALIAVGPVFLALPPGRRLAGVCGCLLAAGLVLAPLLLGSHGGFLASTRVSVSTSTTIFQPWQVWWFFGHHGAPVHGLFGNLKPGYRTAPAWASAISHPLIVLTGFALAAALWPRARRSALGREQALLALALVMIPRCLLDTWDISYYMLPFLLALLAWEASRPSQAPPLLALAATALTWLSFVWLPEHVSADVQALAFLLWTLPLGAWLAVRLAMPAPAGAGAPGGPPSRDGGRSESQSTIARPLGSLVSTS